MANQSNTKKLFRDAVAIEYNNDTYYDSGKPGYCGICGKKTSYKSRLTTESCCSEQCADQLWYEISLTFYSGRK